MYDHGFYRVVNQGISFGSPLSPLLRALYLKPLDDVVAQTVLFYRRFMDDWVNLAPTQRKLRGAVKTVNQALTALKVKKHPDKTFIGHTSRGFDFLSDHLLRP
ncbi:MAG: reverse transcriptase domain-containing protein [Chloroflexota bacterium]